MGTFHGRLKKRREEKKASIRQIARDLKLNKSTYENWELGTYPTNPEVYLKLSDYLNVPILELMYGKEVAYDILIKK